MQDLTVTPEGNFPGIQALTIPTLPFQRDSASSVGTSPGPAGSPLSHPQQGFIQPCLSPCSLQDLQPLPCLIPGMWGWGRAVALTEAAVGEHGLRALWQLLLFQELPQILSFLPSFLPSLHSSTSLCFTQILQALWNFPLSVL